MKSIYPWATVPHLAEEFAPKLQAQCVQTQNVVTLEYLLYNHSFTTFLGGKTFNFEKLVKPQVYENSNKNAKNVAFESFHVLTFLQDFFEKLSILVKPQVYQTQMQNP